MNRRNFFKAVTGFIAGIFVLPSKTIGRKRSGTRLLTVDEIKVFKKELDAKKVSGDILVPITEDGQKFHTGDRVRIADELPIWMSHFPGAGKKATIDYSYDDKFRVKDPPSKRPQYALEIDGLRWSAWYPEYLLTLLSEYQWHKHEDNVWHCKHKNLPAEFTLRDEYDLFTGKKI